MPEAIYEARHVLPDVRQHLLDGLAPLEVEAARQQAAALGLLGWQAWVCECEQTVTAFLCSTPAQMAKSKEFRELQPLLTLAALQRLAAAEPMLKACLDENLCEPIHTGQSWLAAAGLAHAALMAPPNLLELSYWPWAGANPFEPG